MNEENWDLIIEPKKNIWSLNLKEAWRYRDLLIMFVKRDFITTYKQTILGPLWFFIQPIFTTITYTFVFGNLAGISTDGLPKILFYMSGTVCWTYFSDCLNKTSTVFRDNQNIFGKVYFPRIITPLSIVTSGLLKFTIQFTLLILTLLYFNTVVGVTITPNRYIFILPILILLMAGLALGLGMIITSLTTKYRDLVFLLQFGIQLLMYGTPVIYPLSAMSEKYRWLLVLNPMTSIMETFRFIMFGKGIIEWVYILYSSTFIGLMLLFGILIFNKTEKNFMDTV